MTPIDRLARVIEMSMQAVAAIDNPTSMTPLQRVRLILDRDRMLWTELTAEERRLFFVWARQERPS